MCMLLMCCRYAVDLVVCVALGCDMFDCVFPTRTAVSSLYLTLLNSCWAVFTLYKKTDFLFLSPSEVWLCFGALGISPGKTEAVCQGLPAHRPRLPVSHLQEVTQQQRKDSCVSLKVWHTRLFQSIFLIRTDIEVYKALWCSGRPWFHLFNQK